MTAIDAFKNAIHLVLVIKDLGFSTKLLIYVFITNTMVRVIRGQVRRRQFKYLYFRLGTLGYSNILVIRT